MKTKNIGKDCTMCGYPYPNKEVFLKCIVPEIVEDIVLIHIELVEEQTFIGINDPLNRDVIKTNYLVGHKMKLVSDDESLDRLIVPLDYFLKNEKM